MGTTLEKVLPIAISLLFLASVPTRADETFSVRMYVIDADIPPERRALARRLAESGTSKQKQDALEFFGWEARKYATEASSAIIAGLADSDALVRIHAAIALRNLSISAEARAEKLALVWRKDPFAAALASAYLGIHDPRIGAELVKGIEHPEPIRGIAAVAFRNLGPSAAPVFDDLITLLDHKDRHVACNALLAFAEARAAPEKLLPRMLEWVRDRKYCDHQAAAVLGAIGPAAAPAIPDLVKRIQGEAGSCCSNEAEYLVQIGTASVPALLALSEERDEYRKAWALFALGQLAGRDERAAERVFKVLDVSLDENSDAKTDEERESVLRAYSGLSMVQERSEAIGRRLYERLLNRGESLERDERELYLKHFPVRIDESFFKRPPSALTLKLTAPPPEVLMSSGSVFLSLAIKNTGDKAVRILNPGCSASGRDPLDLLLVKEPGYPLLRGPRGFIHMSLPEPTEAESTLLNAGESKSFQCILQAPERPGDRLFLWTYRYQLVGLEGRQADRLIPGRYRVRARYRTDEKFLASYSRWSDALTEKVGRPWMGEAISNEVSFEIK